MDNDMVVIRYEGPRGAPGMPELLDPTSRITALCRQRHITIALMTDARFSGGSVGLVIGHVAPEAFLGGPIALVEDGDTIVVDLTTDRLDCAQIDDADLLERRAAAWQAAAEGNGGIHPDVTPVTDRVLARMRATALPALLGGGMATRWPPAAPRVSARPGAHVVRRCEEARLEAPGLSRSAAMAQWRGYAEPPQPARDSGTRHVGARPHCNARSTTSQTGGRFHFPDHFTRPDQTADSNRH